MTAKKTNLNETYTNLVVANVVHLLQVFYQNCISLLAELPVTELARVDDIIVSLLVMFLQQRILLKSFLAHNAMIELVIKPGILVMELMLNNGKWSLGAKGAFSALVLHILVAFTILGHHLRQKKYSTLQKPNHV